MEKVYELTVLFHPDLEIDLEKPLKKLEGIITDNGGKKQDFAVYVMSEVSIAPVNASKVQNLLNITDEVIRYLMVEKDLKAPAEGSKEESQSDSEDSSKN